MWARMSPSERERVVSELPSEFPPSESSPPEGDHHYETYSTARETLSRWFRERGRRVYVSGNLPVYYPGERMFSPDVIAVLDVEPRPRDSWIVSKEGDRGLDFALDVIVSGRRRKDLQENVDRYARLGIAEYFVFDFAKRSLRAYRLTAEGRYERTLPQLGLYSSAVLGLELSLEEWRLRFSLGFAPLLDTAELLSNRASLANAAELRAMELEAALEDEQRRREEEQHLREEEQRLRHEAEAEVAKLREELERLRKGGG